jgi:hypothetical protein
LRKLMRSRDRKIGFINLILLTYKRWYNLMLQRKFLDIRTVTLFAT